MKFNALFGAAISLSLLAASSAIVTDECLECIRYVESTCRNPNPCCRMDRGSLSCGPFQIKQVYWNDVRVGSNWQSCSCDLNCSRHTVGTYLSLRGRKARSCFDYARIHNGGPRGMDKPGTLDYARRVDRCLQNRAGCK